MVGPATIYKYKLQFAVNTSAAGTRGEMAGPRT
jgi:hypothetical protein